MRFYGNSFPAPIRSDFLVFQTIRLTDTFQGNVELDMECNDLFFWACKDTTAKFIYTFPDGRQETLVLEY